jgi:hypothetical protein
MGTMLYILQVVPASQAQCMQRTGRAGREAPGKCFRLFPEAAFSDLPTSTIPEIQRSNLVAVVLQLKAVGVADVLGFDFLDPPPRDALKNALATLYALQAMVRNRPAPFWQHACMQSLQGACEVSAAAPAQECGLRVCRTATGASPKSAAAWRGYQWTHL